jgi:hypothetical protein
MVLQSAAQYSLQYDQQDPDTGESLLPLSQQQQLQELKKLVDSLYYDLKLQDLRALLPGLLQASSSELLQPARLRQQQQQQQRQQNAGRDLGAQKALNYLRWCPKGRLEDSDVRQNGVAGVATSIALLGESAQEMELDWERDALLVVQVRAGRCCGYCRCCHCRGKACR